MTGKEAKQVLKKRYDYINNYNREKYDRVTVVLPKGTKERIAATGKTCGVMIKEITLDYLDRNGL